MTINGGQPHRVGDHGQRFEVTYKDPSVGVRRVFGWTETVEGYISMVDAIHNHPVWESPKVEDRVKSGRIKR